MEARPTAAGNANSLAHKEASRGVFRSKTRFRKGTRKGAEYTYVSPVPDRGENVAYSRGARRKVRDRMMPRLLRQWNK